MKGATNISAFAVYQKSKSKSNKVSKKKNRKNEKRVLHSIFSSGTNPNGLEKAVIKNVKQRKKNVASSLDTNGVTNPIEQKEENRVEPVLIVEKSIEGMGIKKGTKKKKRKPSGSGKAMVRVENGDKKEIGLKNKNYAKIKHKINQPIQSTTKPAEKLSNAETKQAFSCNNDLENAEQLFQWLLAPTTLPVFYKEHWEKKPLHIKRPDLRDYFKHLFSSEDLDTMLRENSLFYTRNVDVVTYCDGKRETHNPAEIRATPSAVWDYYSNECSVRILNPQTYNGKIHLLLATLQEYFGNTMGANVYLTPPGSQGFAPHWDDIEAFVLQLEGRKHWKLYGPKNKNQVLARHSSHNLSPDELGPLKYSVTVEAGDLLYFPRGTIHEACTDEDSHSLHITVSVYQNTCFADLLEKVLPDALKKAAEADVEFRRGLPLQYLTNVGVAVKQDQEYRRKMLLAVKQLMTKMIDHIDINTAADQLGKKFMYDSLPPVLTNEEKLHTVRNDGEVLVDGKVFNRIEFQPDTQVRLLRQFCLRLIIEDKEAKIYYNTENSRLFHGEEEQFLEIDVALVPAVSHLICSFPNFVAVEDLPINDDDLKLQIVSDLWERGLVVTKDRLDCIDHDNDDDDE